MNISNITRHPYFQLLLGAAGVASLIAAVIAVMEWKKKSLQYDLQNEKVRLEIKQLTEKQKYG
jgi:hypothetical protein